MSNLFRLFFTALAIFLIPTTALAASEWDQSDVSVTKEWTIQFNTSLLEQSINSDRVYVLDENKDVLDTIKLAYNDKEHTILVTNIKPYNTGETYTLHITEDVLSSKDKAIQTPIEMTFTTTDQPAQPPSTGGNSISTGSSSSSNDSTDDEELETILSEYEKKLNSLEDDANEDLNNLVDQGLAEYKAEEKSFSELLSEYTNKADTLENEIDRDFEEIIGNLKEELEANGYSKSHADSFEEDYKQAKNDREEELINNVLSKINK